MLPDFPEFRALSLELQPIVETFARRFPCYSDFNFISMYSWDVDGRTRLCMHEGHLLVLFPGYGDDDPGFLSFLGAGRTAEVAREMLDHASRTDGIDASLALVPGCVTGHLRDEPDLHVAESSDNHDYIFDTVDFINRPGQKHRESRWVLNRLEARHRVTTQSHQLNAIDSVTRAAVARVAERWANQHRQVDGAIREHGAIERILSRPPLGATLVVAEVDGCIDGFAIVERSPDGTGFVHFEKANLEIDGLSDYIWRAGARHLLELGCSSFNGEQDLGLPGLRQWKQKRRPREMLYKYEVHRRPA